MRCIVQRIAQSKPWPVLQRQAARYCLQKDVETVNKTPIASTMTEGLYKYLLTHTREPQVLQELRVATSEFTASRMQITPEQGQFMAMLVKIMGVKNYIEIGVFTGYSLIATALALPPDGMAIALDRDPRALKVARQFVEQAGISSRVDIREGPALESLKDVRQEFGLDQFDLVFVDADKRGYKQYYEESLELVRSGGLILLDNVLWYGKVADSCVVDKQTQSLRDLTADLLEDSRIDLSIVPIGDGIAMCRKR